MYNKAMTTIYRQPSAWEYEGVYIMPETVETVVPYAFSYYPMYIYTIIGSNGSINSASSRGFSTTKTLLKGVVLSGNLSSIGLNAFYGHSGLTDVTASEQNGTNMLSIGSYSFYGCKNMVTLELPNNTVSIDTFAFGNCVSLLSFTFTPKLQTIGANAFINCRSLKEITINALAEGFNPINSFSNCDSLGIINVDPNNKLMKSVDGVLYNPDMTELYFYPMAKSDEVFTIPNTVIKISYGAFSNNQIIKKVIIPASVKVISDKAFFNTKNLNEYVFLGLDAPALECSYSSAGFSYSQFRGNMGRFEGELTLYCYEGSNYDNYIWNSFFTHIVTVPVEEDILGVNLSDSELASNEGTNAYLTDIPLSWDGDNRLYKEVIAKMSSNKNNSVLYVAC
ncbi:MAG: leucine-rich repeat domain-containing protein [Clostridia bacterium]|nr:leucine-rich repeat domain-containing protein [Clostridia bacterium]